MSTTAFDVAIHARWVIPVDSDTKSNVLDHHTVCCLDGKIAKVLPTKEFESLGLTAKEIVRLADHHALIPGLINCHTHAGMTMLRGYADDQPLSVWLQEFIWPAEGKFMSPDWVKLGAQLAAYEMLKTGTTCINDMYFLPESAAAVFESAKLRAHIGSAILDFGDGKVAKMAEDAKEYVRRLLKEKGEGKHKYITPSFNLHSCYTVGMDVHKDITNHNQAAEGPGVVYHTHVHETKQECDQYLEKHGQSAVHHMHSVGALNARTIAAHCVWLDDAEIAIFAQTGANVAHCPRSNMKLASGFAKVDKLLQAGVNVCIGTDSSSSNNSLDLLAEAQAASLIAKAVAGSAAAVPDWQALCMATRNGARALGRLHELGSIEEGKLADMAAVDLGAVDLLPLYDPVSHIIYTTARKVSDVWVGGERVVRDECVLSIEPDREAIAAATQEIRAFKEVIVAKRFVAGA